MIRPLQFAAAVLCTALCATFAPVSLGAQYAYEAQPDSSLNLLPGAEVTVRIFLTETLEPGETSAILAGQGLSSADFKIVLSASDAATPTQVLTGGDVVVGPEFDPSFSEGISVSPTVVRVLEFAEDVDFGTGAVGTTETTAGGRTQQRIVLADVTFTTGSAGTTVFRIFDDETGESTTTLGSAEPPATEPMSFDSRFESDPNLAPSITFTVVPEPASAGLLLLAAPLMRRRRV
ncbi:MAG TPA: hypothetical protein VF624_17735 [Tepidisphaeraceae bacterium]|jgi:hypothetical protein